MGKKIKVLNFSVGEKAELIEIDNDFIELQKLVDGYIQIIPISENLCIICNELRKLKNLPYQKKYKIHGNFIIAQTFEDELISIDTNSVNKIVKEIQCLSDTLI